MKWIQSELSRPYLLASGLAFLVLAVFWVGVDGGFIFDDFPTIVNNELLHIEGFSLNAISQAAFSFQPGGVGRPLSMLTLAVNHALDGMNPYGYKVTGLLIHAVNAVLIFFLTLRTLELSDVSRGRVLNYGAFAISLMWALHPIQVSSVLYVVQRMETLSLTFVLMALLLYLQGRMKQIDGESAVPYFILCVPLFVLGVLAKESAVLFLLYCAAFEMTLLRFSAKDKRITKLLFWLYGVGAVLALVAYFLLIVPHYSSDETHTGRFFNTAERLLTQLRVLPLYLKQMLVPLPESMSFYYDNYPVSSSLLKPITTLYGCLLISVLVLAALFLLRKNSLFSLGVLLFFSAHVLTSNVIALELVFEHRNYFALFGVVLAVAGLVSKTRAKDSSAMYLGIGAVVIGYVFLGWIRAATWGDPLLLAVDHAKNNPQSARAAHAMGVTYYEMAEGSVSSPFFNFAFREFEREAELPHASILAEQSLILLSAQAGQNTEEKWWGQLVHKLETQPVTVESTSAMFALADNHINGANIDGEKVLDAFIVMFSKVGMSPQSYISVAEYALKTVKNETVAKNILFYGIERSAAHPDYIVAVITDLHRNGYIELASSAEQFAISSGVLASRYVEKLAEQRDNL